jgi:hypothetical protein
MHPAILARYREAPDKATRDALEQEYPGIAAEVASRPHEAAQAREIENLRVPVKERVPVREHVPTPVSDEAPPPPPVLDEPKEKPATKDGPRTRRVTRKPRASSKRSSRT